MVKACWERAHSLLDKVQMRVQRRAGYGATLLRIQFSPYLVIFSYFAQVVISLSVKSEEKCVNKKQILITVPHNTSSY
jgi:hypothetical protein